MLQAERRGEILETLREEGKVAVPELCERFHVSEMTIRRDLRDLDREGLLRRVHGGAIFSLGRSYEPPYQLRATDSSEAKQAIGRSAADMIFDGDSIALDIGTTTFEIARSIRDKRNLTIVTASLPIAFEITSNVSLNSDVRLILTGGIVRPGELSMIGHLADHVYREFHVDKAFVGIGGLSLEAGLTEYNLEDALVKRPLLETAHQKIVVADGSKFGRTTFVSIGPLSAIDTVITDETAPKDMVQALQDLGIQVTIAT
jgi:DeoR/GlpR family transcriptional regulator of sugar metabolism